MKYEEKDDLHMKLYITLQMIAESKRNLVSFLDVQIPLQILG